MAARTDADSGGNGCEAGLRGAIEGRLEVRDSKAEVMDAGSPSFDVSCDRRIGPGRFEQFDPSRAIAEESDPDAFGGNFFRAGGVYSQQSLPGWDRLGEGFDRDSDVIDLVQVGSLQ
jgi:hypothetical protein